MPFFFARNRFFGRWTRLSFRSIRSARSNNASENGIQAKEATEDIFEGIKTHIERKAGFKQWLAEIKRKLTEQPTGPFLLGASRPFAHNPEFAPRPPITEALRDRLYQLYTTEPSNWTPRKLSAAFKVSIPRIKAIIKIKEREIKTIAEGKLKPDQEYVQKMEEILGAQAPVQVEPELTRDNSISAHVRPTFVAIPENSDISPEVIYPLYCQIISSNCLFPIGSLQNSWNQIENTAAKARARIHL